jgi:hypothetical protein
MAQTESSTLSFRLPDAAAGDRPRYAGMNVERPLLLAAIGRFGSTAAVIDVVEIVVSLWSLHLL